MSTATDGPLQLDNRLVRFREPIVVTAPTLQKPAILASRGLLAAIVLLGISLRVVPMVQDRDLWIDEAMLGLNLVERSPRQLLRPLDWNQGAPVGFLIAVKSTMVVFGSSECAMRLVSFLGSVLGLIGFAWLARRMLPGSAAMLAAFLYAIGPHIISYAAECKQYATDAALTVGMFAAAQGLFYGGGGVRRWAVLAGAGAVAVWFSHPVAFVLGGIGGALFLDAAARRDRLRVYACLATIGCWLASFGVCYVLFLQQLGNNQFLVDYWAGHFLPLPPRELGDLAWLADHYFGPIAYPGGLGGTEVQAGGIAAVLFAVGIAAIARERWPLAVALIAPGVLALLASGLHLYPFAGRLLLFLVPVLILGVARGAWAVATALRPSQPFAATVLVAVLLAAPALESYQQLRRPLRHEQVDEVIAELRDRVQPDDRVYLYYGAIPAFTFYTRDTPLEQAITRGGIHRDNPTGYRDELRRFAGQPRVWLLFSHPHSDEEELIRAYADSLGECREVVHRAGASAYRYDFATAR